MNHIRNSNSLLLGSIARSGSMKIPLEEAPKLIRASARRVTARKSTPILPSEWDGRAEIDVHLGAAFSRRFGEDGDLEVS